MKNYKIYAKDIWGIKHEVIVKSDTHKNAKILGESEFYKVSNYILNIYKSELIKN